MLNASSIRRIRNAFLWVLNATDRILATHEAFLLGTWLEDAKLAAPAGLSALFEWNARRQLTIWPPDNVSVCLWVEN